MNDYDKAVVWGALDKEFSEPYFQKRLKKHINLVEREDWTKHQICGDYPNVDLRCLAFCCTPEKKCPHRNSVLKKVGLTVEDYTNLKREFAEGKLNLPKLRNSL